MKIKKSILFAASLLLSFGVFAQNGDCTTTQQLFFSNAKVKNYKAAMPQYLSIIENCPKPHIAVYQYGERMFRHFLEEGEVSKQKENAQLLIESYKKRLADYPSKTKEGETLAKIAQAMYDNNIGTKAEQYAAFDKAWESDKESFLSPKSLYTYFSLLVDLHDAGKKNLQEVFDKYDEVIAQIEKLENTQAEKAATLSKKQEAGTELTAAEQRTLGNSQIYLKNYSTIKGSINAKLGQRADCENLIPLYQKDFEAQKGNIEWLKRAAARLYSKECTDSSLFVELVEAQHNLEPSAKSALYLGKLAEERGDNAKALEYYKQSAELETNPADKARVYYVLGNSYKQKGQYSTARSFYRKALENKPSMGAAYLQIAAMYAASANNCGESSFDKRAVYWLAADYAERAGKVNASLKDEAQSAAASYSARAPQRSDIFTSGRGGQTINIGCWIGGSVRVPEVQ